MRSKLVEALLAQRANQNRPIYSPLEAIGNIAMTYALNKRLGKEQTKESGEAADLAKVLATTQSGTLPISIEDPTGTSTPTSKDYELRGGETRAVVDPQRQAMLMALSRGDPDVLSGAALQQYLKTPENEDFTLGEGQTRFRGKQVIASVPKGASPDEDAREKKIQQYMDTYGIRRDRAIALVDKQIQMGTTPDERGMVTEVNPISGSARQISARGGSTSPIADVIPQLGPERQPFAGMRPATGVDDKTVRDAQAHIGIIDDALSQADLLNFGTFKEGTGPQGYLSRKVASGLQAVTLGWGGNWAGNRKDAVNQIELFNQKAKAAASNNPRFPVTEQQLVQNNLLPDPAKVGTNPDEQAMKFSRIQQMLLQGRENEAAAVEGRQPIQVPRSRTGAKSDPIQVPDDADVNELIKTLPANVYVLYKGQLFMTDE